MAFYVCYVYNKCLEKGLRMSEEENNNDNNNSSNNNSDNGWIVILLFVCLFVSGSYYWFKDLDEKLDIKIDFEKKSYIPVVLNNEMFLVNKHNGKTYKLNYNEAENTYIYKYVLVAKPKSKMLRFFNKKDPLDILDNNAINTGNKPKRIYKQSKLAF